MKFCACSFACRLLCVDVFLHRATTEELEELEVADLYAVLYTHVQYYFSFPHKIMLEINACCRTVRHTKSRRMWDAWQL